MTTNHITTTGQLRYLADTRILCLNLNAWVMLLRGFARVEHGVYTLKRYKQLQVKDLPRVPTWCLERDSPPAPFFLF